MTPGSIISGILHLALALLVVFGLPSFMKPLPEPELPSTVEVVTLAPKATAPEFTKPPVPKQPEPPKPPEAKQEPTPPAPPPKAAVEPPKPEPTPPKPEPPKPAPVEKAEPIKKEEPKKEEVKKEPPKPVEARKPEKDRFDSVLDSVLKNRAPARPTPPADPQAKPVQQAAAPQRPTAPTFSEQLARSELDAVREKVRPCWNFPAGAPNPEKLAVEIWVQMNPNGTVREAGIYDRSRLNDPFYRAAAEAALRAALNPACQPYPLPPHKYHLWRSFSFIFDPRDL